MKRPLLTVILFLLLGAIVNVAVAWGVRLFAPYGERNRVEINPAALPVWWDRHAPEDWPRDVPSSGWLQGERNFYTSHEVDVLWLASSPTGESWLIYVIKVGWPCMALDGVKLSDNRLIGIIDFRDELLPFRPLWPGFAINTVFYAAVLWLLFAGPFALRRRRRIKRGQCPKCAYPVGKNERCTECGTAHEVKP